MSWADVVYNHGTGTATAVLGSAFKSGGVNRFATHETEVSVSRSLLTVSQGFIVWSHDGAILTLKP